VSRDWADYITRGVLNTWGCDVEFRVRQLHGTVGASYDGNSSPQ
tara:strand:+ start:279 stop:410 length:132 start_codon:yes stop_codon:yes gene_type:complete